MPGLPGDVLRLRPGQGGAVILVRWLAAVSYVLTLVVLAAFVALCDLIRAASFAILDVIERLPAGPGKGRQE